MKRNFDPAEPELMDRPQPVSAELEGDLRNIRQLNRWFAVIAWFLSLYAAGSSRATNCALSILLPDQATFPD